MAENMRAWRYRQHGPVDQVLGIEELAQPAPAPGQALVRVQHVSLNPLDWKLVEGQFRLFTRSQPPCGVGTEFSGELIGLGSHGGIADSLRPGLRVLAWMQPSRQQSAALAGYAAVPVSQILPLPDGVDPAAACTLPVAACSALEMCRSVGVQPGTRLLVNGAAGGVGSATVLWALLQGAQVSACASAGHHDYLRSLGAQRCIDNRATATAQWGEGNGLDAVIDCVGSLSQQDLRVLLPRGGAAVSTLPRWPGTLFDALLNPLRRIRRDTLMVRRDRDDLKFLLEQLRQRRFVPRISARFSFADAARALGQLRRGPVQGKLVVDVAA